MLVTILVHELNESMAVKQRLRERRAVLYMPTLGALAVLSLVNFCR